MQNPPQVSSQEVKWLSKLIEAKKNYEAILAKQGWLALRAFCMMGVFSPARM
jgi:hypothetical protein